MPNKNYIKGRSSEYLAKKELEKNGWAVFRTAGSKSEADLIAIDLNQIKLIQVKSTNKKRIRQKMYEKDIEKLAALWVPPNCKKELWIKQKGIKGFKIIRIEGVETY